MDPVYRAALHPNAFEYEKSFYFRELKVTPIKLQGHNVECSGYIFNDGEVVHISDFGIFQRARLSLSSGGRKC